MANTITFWALELTTTVLIIVLCLLMYQLRKNTQRLQNLSDKIHSANDDKEQEQFNGEQAEKWFEKGELNELDRYCEGFIKQSPNSVHANWYYALSHYNQGDYIIAREYFEKVIHINPLWREGAIVYLQEIAEKIGLPQTTTLH